MQGFTNERFEVDVSADQHALQEVYLPRFKAVLEAGADSVMSSCNRVRGEYMDVNRALLTDALRHGCALACCMTRRGGCRARPGPSSTPRHTGHLPTGSLPEAPAALISR